MTWRVLIADDEPLARRGVRQLLAPFPEFSVAGEARNGIETLAALDRLDPDVLFLDVQMPGLSGFDVIRERGPERMPTVIFLTAYAEFALPAFESEAIDYLVKPVAEARFATTMQRVTRLLRSGRRSSPTLTVSSARGTALVPITDVDWIESADNYARVWTGRRSFLIRESLHELERRFKAHGLIRASRYALVAVRSVRAIERGVAELQTGAKIPISRRCRARFSSAVHTAWKPSPPQ